MGYPRCMAKVLVSLPDDVLSSLDERVRAQGTTRSGLLCELIERELEADAAGHAAEMKRLLARPGRHGGSATEAVRADRSSR